METFHTKYGNITLYNNESYIGNVFKNKGYWDIDTLLKLQKYIDPTKNILEIGGHCGTSSVVYSSFLKEGKIFVYEPQKNMYKLLVKNINQNNLQDKIIPYNSGVFCYNGNGNMNDIDIDGGGGNVTKRYNEEKNLPCNFGGIGLGGDGELIKLVTIDSMNLDNIGYIHCDAQGAENFIFSGGLETIDKNRPVIYYEDNERCSPVLYNNVCKSYPQYRSNSKFDIKKYCIEELKYSEYILNFNGGHDTLLIPSIDLSLYEKRIFSQNGEDGVTIKLLELIYHKAITDTKFYVEFGVESGVQCNTRILRENYKWKGLMMDGSNEKLDINLKKEFITKENICELFEKHNVPKHINLLSVDIDFNDYHVLKEILPKYKCDIIICEYNATHLANEDKVIQYDKNGKWDMTNYFGASLLAFNKLATHFNYILVYCENKGVNCFFIHNDIIQSKNLKFLNAGNVEKIYRKANYGCGPNGGHMQDTLNRKYISFNYITKFPKVIYFCNKTIGKNDLEATNKWKILNPEYEIKLYDDIMCKSFLLENFGQLHSDIYDFLKDGPIKAGFWRVCVLYVYGGVYSDIDNKPVVAFDQFVENDIDLLVCSSYANIPPLSFNFNPNLICCSKGNSILKTAIDWYLDKYNKGDAYAYWDYSVVRCFTDILHLDNYNKADGIYYLNTMKIQILKEICGKTIFDNHNIYKNEIIFYNRSEIWDSINHKFY